MIPKPSIKPICPNFSSGPCAKRPNWSFDVLKNALIGRSHRSVVGKERLKLVIDLHRETLGIPDDYLIAIVPASDTGAIEMAMWSMLGERGVDVLAWENFSNDWMNDIVNELKITDTRKFIADYGEITDLTQIDCDRDVVFVWNGTTSGVRIPNHDWIKSNRQGLTFCDATSAVYGYEMDWSKLDITTWSWQKVLGGEGAHGMLVLSPRAVTRLKTFKPNRPMPKIFRMIKKGELIDGLFRGETLNTPSMLAVEDCIDTLNWVKSIGGWRGSEVRCINNLTIVEDWVKNSNWAEFLPQTPDIRSRTSICLKIKDARFTKLDDAEQKSLIKKMVKLIEDEGVAYDFASYITAPAGFRIWGGATIESSDITALLPWIDWAYTKTML